MRGQSRGASVSEKSRNACASGSEHDTSEPLRGHGWALGLGQQEVHYPEEADQCAANISLQIMAPLLLLLLWGTLQTYRAFQPLAKSLD
ncbi:hypothetical protein MHYP_G00165710 [Metynnis hypsauchen]